MAASSVNHFDGKSYPNGVAAEDLTGARFVDITQGYETGVQFSIADSGDVVSGIVAETVSSGDTATVFYSGVGLLDVDATSAISVGSKLKPDGSGTGKGIVTTSDQDAYGAIALQAVASGTATIPVLILPWREASNA